jgi:hypothetical protein
MTLIVDQGRERPATPAQIFAGFYRSRSTKSVINVQRCNKFLRDCQKKAHSDGILNGTRIAFDGTGNDTIHQSSMFRLRTRSRAMIVQAAARFGCRHRFVVTDQDGILWFVCEGCGHRTDLLPVHLDKTRGQIVEFPRQAAGILSPEPLAEPAARSSRQRATRQRG